MAKFKPAGSRKPTKGPRAPGMIPCLILLVTLFGLLGFLLFYSLQK